MTLQELNRIVAYCTSPSGNPFYRHLYGMDADDNALSVDDEDAWHSLTPLTKHDMETVPLIERLFTDMKDVESIRMTSGTSGKPPLFSPRAHEWRHELDAYNLPYHDFSKPTLIAGPLHRFGQMAHHGKDLHNTIALDLHHLRTSVALAAAAKIDSMITLPSLIPTLTPLMAEFGLAHEIKYIEMSGDGTTRSLFAFIKDHFPRAVVMSTYAISEAGGILGTMCHPMTDSDPLEVFHAAPGVHVDIVDPVTVKPITMAVGAEGELLVTSADGGAASFPVIRYRTNDLAVIKSYCHEHDAWAFALRGRIEADSIKVPGGLLQAAEIERVLGKLSSYVASEYEARYSISSNPPVFALTLYVAPIPAETNLQALAETIARELRISQNHTYAEGVARGMYAPLVCLPLVTTPGVKRRKIAAA